MDTEKLFKMAASAQAGATHRLMKIPDDNLPTLIRALLQSDRFADGMACVGLIHTPVFWVLLKRPQYEIESLDAYEQALCSG